MAIKKAVAAPVEASAMVVASAVETAVVPAPKKKKHPRVWNTEAAVQENYRRAIEMFETEGQSNAEKLRSVGEIRQHLSFAAHLLESHYTADAAREYMEIVEEVLNEIDSTLRFKVDERLLARRVARAAGVKKVSGERRPVAQLSRPVGPVDTDEG